MTTPISTNSTKVPYGAGSTLNSEKYDAAARRSELQDRSSFMPHVFVATVLEVNQKLQSYRLRVGGLPDQTAQSVELFGRGLLAGTRASYLYGVGTRVLAITTPGIGVNRSIILGGIPVCMGILNSAETPELTVSSPVGSFKDDISDTGLLSSIFNNFGAGRPLDAYPGDTTMLNSFGCGLVIGALQVSLMSGLGCSVECHYVDDLLRINSFNFEQNTSSAETSMFNDAGDYTEVKRLSPYVVQSLGGTEQYGVVPHVAAKERTTTASSTDVTGVYKPELDTQIGWWRLVELDGYLANVKLHFVTVPLLTSTRDSSKTEIQDEVGVFRSHVDSTGAYSVVSAKSISLIKDCFIPVPRERYKPDDSRGNKQEDILEARQENDKNLLDYTLKDQGTQHGSLLYAATSSDLAAFKTHRTLVHFRERPKDWTLKEIDEVDLAGFKDYIASEGLVSISAGPAAGKMFTALPKVGLLRVSAREDVKYFASRSMIMLNDDGSIHLQDGYGSSISMRGGSIDISCPGDITMRPGRNMISIAGDTVSCIAGTDIELAANLGDIRIQADRNVSVLGGNDGSGGILLETKATAASLYAPDEDIYKLPTSNINAYRGIWFKAPNSTVSAVAPELYFGNQAERCDIYLDSGSGSVQVTGRDCSISAKTTTICTDPANPSSGSSLMVYSGGVAMLTKTFFLQARQFFATGDSTNISFSVVGSAFFTGNVIAPAFASKSGKLGKVDPSVLDSRKQELETRARELVSGDGESTGILGYLGSLEERSKMVDKSVYGSESSSLTNLTFCYPDSDLRGAVGTASCVMFEADWQQLYRSQGVGSPMIFKGVDSTSKTQASPGISASNSYFWPGAKALMDKFGKLGTEGRYVDGKLRFKATGFDTPLEVGQELKSFEGNYTVATPNGIKSKQS